MPREFMGVYNFFDFFRNILFCTGCENNIWYNFIGKKRLNWGVITRLTQDIEVIPTGAQRPTISQQILRT